MSASSTPRHFSSGKIAASALLQTFINPTASKSRNAGTIFLKSKRSHQSLKSLEHVGELYKVGFRPIVSLN